MSVEEESVVWDTGSSASVGGGDVVALNSLRGYDYSMIMCDMNHPIDVIVKMLRCDRGG